MDDTATLINIGAALAIGILIGIERGWHERGQSEGQRIAGIRTFALIGLLGGVITSFAGITPTAFAAVFAGIAILLAAAWYKTSSTATGFGITTTIAALLTFSLGALAGTGNLFPAAAGGVVTALLLYMKPGLHHWLEKMQAAELNAGLRLAAISILLLPILPNTGYGPWAALNPFEIWLMVVAIASLSFLGYVMVRLMGPKRGLMLAALAGGLVSSTAVSISFARHSHTMPAHAKTLATAIVLANCVMFPRIFIVASLISPELAPVLGPPMGLALLCGLALVGWRLRQAVPSAPASTTTAVEEAVPNPMDLRLALGFGAFLAVIMLASRAAEHWLGTGGVFGLAAISGVADVDAITLSLASQAGDLLTAPHIAAAISLAAVSNVAFKWLMAARLGTPALRPALHTAMLGFVLATCIGLLPLLLPA